ncbi:hypothetical protein ACHAW5_009250 [Stephanodiscus triporus]|uniref:Glycolipid transfer protein domain-containing protein n=1 Tax=Stephanodiscus triporus TaxID=2934178 RepID=A0ABD3NM56_9STRA
MIAERTRSISKIPYYSTGTLNELELDGYCDFGFPIGAHDVSFDDDDDDDCPSPRSSMSPSTPPSTLWSFASTMPRVTSSKLMLKSSRLDEVVRSFARCFAERGRGRDVDAGRLLRAIRAHLDLMRSVGGSALCLVCRDLENNLNKAEAVHGRMRASTSTTSSSYDREEFGTLASLLEHERMRDPGLHAGNALGESSAAMGLLWIRRSLAFQSHLFESLIPSPDEYEYDEDDAMSSSSSSSSGGRRRRHPRDAANEAYQLHLAPYHGWMLRAAFPASLSQMPSREVFLSKFGEVELDDLDRDAEYVIVRKLRALVSTLEPLLMLWRESYERLDLEDTRKV